jgi:chaperonin GroEL
MPKQLMFDAEARNKVREGVAKLARAVRVTMGPTGRNVILQKSFGKPTVTKDGVTVAKDIELSDPFENMGARLVQEVANKTATTAGDGTTTATVFADALYAEGLRALVAGVNPVAVKRGIDRAVSAAVEAIKAQSRPVEGREDVRRVAYISSREEEVANVIADAFEKVGKEGVITIEEGRGIQTELEVVEGFQFDKGYISAYFVTNPTEMTCVLEDPLILLHEKKISNLRDFLPAMEHAARAGRPLVVIAEDVEGEALAALVVNRLRGVLPCVAVKAPGFGDRRKDMLEDMAVLTGGRVISEDIGVKLEHVTAEFFGSARKVIVEKDATTIVEGKGDRRLVEARVKQVKTQIEQSTSDYDRDKLKERLAKLSGGVAEIRVGGATEPDMKERKMRVDDALHAARAALEEGVLPGGGVAFIHAIPALDAVKPEGHDERIGVEIVRKALEAPIRQICENAGFDGSVAVEDARRSSGAEGLDARTGKWVDMWKAGIIDPTKVARSALQNAASVAGLMLTTQTLVTDFKEEAETEIAGAVR